MKIHAFRLHKGDDLKLNIYDYCKNSNIKAGVILSGVGCLSKANIRCANGKTIIELNQNLEIISLNGTIADNGLHIHIGVSDDKLVTYGGHLSEGSIINTTCEVIIGEIDSYTFTREFDETTGYKEIKMTENH